MAPAHGRAIVIVCADDTITCATSSVDVQAGSQKITKKLPVTVGDVRSIVCKWQKKCLPGVLGRGSGQQAARLSPRTTVDTARDSLSNQGATMDGATD